MQSKNEAVLAIADGAAVGSQMNLVGELLERQKNFFLFAAESFEWLILQSEIINDKEIKNILENPENFIESKDFFSWEQFFTKLLIEKTNGTYLKYLKRKLNQNYISENVKNKILDSDLMKKVVAMVLGKYSH